ncbi:hydrogenase nickel incorporation protein HypB [Candidatus Bathyarchaeota archaeon]|nr:hydrogenase nickel incorporation protein HypB [Candidatus Bathyarchaeota archaeon]
MASEEENEVVLPDEDLILDIELEENLLKKNKELAEENRRRLRKAGVRTIDIMGSIGSGKTSLIEELAKALKDRYRIAMIAGDVTTSIDAERVRRHGIKSVQVNTGKECHLDANLVRKALEKLDLSQIDLLLIENVGNLICPIEFDLGANTRVVVISVTEGEYMVLKHPMMFRGCELLVINKIDLAEAMGIKPDRLADQAIEINPAIKVVKTCLREGKGTNGVVEALNL